MKSSIAGHEFTFSCRNNPWFMETRCCTAFLVWVSSTKGVERRGSLSRRRRRAGSAERTKICENASKILEARVELILGHDGEKVVNVKCG